MARRPSTRCLNSSVTLIVNTWGKDTAGGRTIASSRQVGDVTCQWDPGESTTSVDETGRWTTEQMHVFRFLTDPGLKAQDVIRVVDGSRVRDCYVSRPTNPAGRNVFWEVPAMERY